MTPDQITTGFAVWLQENRWFSFDKQANKWCYTFEQGTSMKRSTYEKNYMKTSEELLYLYKKENNITWIPS